jgi:hypothetical protein
VGVRRLTVLPCSESWAEMRMDGDAGARFCDHCEQRVQPIGELDVDGFEALLRGAASTRTCLRVELDGGRPKLATGVAVNVLVMTLASCTQTSAELVTPVDARAPDTFLYLEPLDERASSQVTGFVLDAETREAVAGAVVYLEGESLTEELVAEADELGMYAFVDVPPGNYKVVAFPREGRGMTTTALVLPAHARANVSFAVDTREYFMGMVWEYDPRFGEPGPHLADTSTSKLP